MIEEHNKNADKHGYTMRMNKFGDMTAVEFAAKFNGYKWIPTKTNSTKVFKYQEDIETKESIDWRQYGAVTEVKDQGDCGSCWAFSATGSLEGQHFLKAGQLVMLSEQDLIDCSKSYGNYGCDGGLAKKAYNYIINSDGISTEFSYPYRGDNSGNCRFNSAVGATMTDYVQVDSNVNAVTQAINNIGPIAVSMDASLKSFHFYDSGVYSDSNCSSIVLDHAVLAVGYGVQESTSKPYFLVKNSWGMDWGMEGYFMIARDMCGIATHGIYPIV